MMEKSDCDREKWRKKEWRKNRNDIERMMRCFMWGCHTCRYT